MNILEGTLVFSENILGATLVFFQNILGGTLVFFENILGGNLVFFENILGGTIVFLQNTLRSPLYVLAYCLIRLPKKNSGLALDTPPEKCQNRNSGGYPETMGLM